MNEVVDGGYSMRNVSACDAIQHFHIMGSAHCRPDECPGLHNHHVWHIVQYTKKEFFLLFEVSEEKRWGMPLLNAGMLDKMLCEGGEGNDEKNGTRVMKQG